MIRDHKIPVGHLWKKKDRDGNTYLAGVISLGIFGEIPVVIFEEKKENEKAADYVIRSATNRRDVG